MSDDSIDRAMRHLLVGLETNGVASINVSDGQIFAFTAEKLRVLLEAADESEEKRVIVMVKRGPVVTDKPEDN